MCYTITHLRGSDEKRKYFKPKDYILQMQINNLKSTDIRMTKALVKLNYTVSDNIENLTNTFNTNVDNMNHNIKQFDKSLLFLLYLISKVEKKGKIQLDIPNVVKQKMKETINQLTTPLLTRMGIDFFKEIALNNKTTLG